MERPHFSEEVPNKELLYNSLRERLTFGGNTIEWWQAVFDDLARAKSVLQNQNLVASVDFLLIDYQDLTKWIRKDKSSMAAALKRTHLVIEQVLDDLGQH